MARFVLHRGSMRDESPAVRELATELTHLLVAIDAHIVRTRRSVPSNDPLGGLLREIDESFAEPIALARRLLMAVHVTHETSPPPALGVSGGT